MSIAASAPHKQAPFSKIVSAVASARTQLRAGASLNSVIRPALLNVPLESRPAAQALIYESVRRCARTTALVGLLCSRQPDTPWLRRPDDIKKLASEQKRLLKTLWPLLRKGGRMLYATCSIFPEEGTGQMKAFLAATPDARLVPLFAGNDGMLTLLPEESGEWRSDAQLPTVHDGFFYALLEKQA